MFDFRSWLLRPVLKQLEAQMSALTDLQSAANDLGTQVDSVVSAIADLKAQIANGSNDAAQLAAVTSQLADLKSKLATAIA